MTVSEPEQVETESVNERGRLAAVLGWTISVLVLALYGWAVVNAVGNFVGLRGFAQSLGSDLTFAGWFWLVGGMALPVIVAALAFVIARKQQEKRWLVLFVGLAVVAMLQLNVQHLIPQSSFLGV